MNTKALDAMMGKLAPIVHEHIGKAVRPLEARIVALEQRGSAVEQLGPIRDEIVKLALRVGEVEEREPVPGPPGPQGEPGTDVDHAEVEKVVDVAVQRAVAALPLPENGKDGSDGVDGKDGADAPAPTLEQIKDALTPREGHSSLLRSAVADYMSDFPPPAGKDADPVLIEKMVADAVAALPPAPAGKSVTVEDVRPLLEQMVAEIPRPENGKDADPVEVERIVGLAVDRAVAALPVPENGKDGKDGIGLAGAVIDRDGHLIVTLSDGGVFNVGPVVGKDGAPGIAGKSGVDGLGVGDFNVAFDGRRTVTLNWSNSEKAETRSFQIPAMIDAGVWKEGPYEAGDTVSFRGHLWTAQKNTSTQPDAAHEDWRMAMRKPRDGRDGKPGERGIQGPKGDRGELGPRAYGG